MRVVFGSRSLLRTTNKLIFIRRFKNVTIRINCDLLFICSYKILEMNQVPKALIVNQTKGLIKMVVNSRENNKILGVHILSEMAADIIHEAVFAIKYNLTIDDIIDTIHVFPTLTESIKLVATSFKQNGEKLTCCAQ
jgi:mercuric reductase